MGYTVKQGNIFGRIGSGIGQGLAEQIPKEIDRTRLQAGLEDLSQNAGNLTPFQRFAKLSGIPGITPQAIQSGSQLLQQEAKSKAFGEFTGSTGSAKTTAFPGVPVHITKDESKQETPSLTTEKTQEKVIESYIRPTIQERDSIAKDAFNSAPAYFNNDPQKAIDWADDKIAQEEKIAQDYQTKHANLNAIQENVVTRLDGENKRLGSKVPAEIYTRIEDEAIQATKPKKDGGDGLTEQQAMKKYASKLAEVSRDWGKIPTWGTWGITQKSADETLRSMKVLQEKMENLDATDLYANEIQSANKVSPKLSYAIAQPVSRVPELNGFLKSIPNIKVFGDLSRPNGINPEKAKSETLRIAPMLGEIVKKNEKASPLAIAYELEKKGFDPNAWLQWASDNSRKLNLKQRQLEQLEIPQQHIVPMADYWLQSFSGIQ